MKAKKPFLSVIIPVYNEAKRLDNLTKIHKFFKIKKFKTEIAVVNDGSTDDTLKLLNSYKKKLNIKVLTYPKNRGKGYAVKTGMLKTAGKYKLFTDIDLSTPLVSFDKFYPYLKTHDIVLGTRKTKGSKVMQHQPMYREWMGKGFTLLSQIILNVEVSDFTCGFKLFSDKAARKIFKNLTIDRWGFDSEALFLAKKYKFKIKEVPVRWVNNPDTKVNLFRDTLTSLRDILRIRRNDLMGRY